MGWVCRLRAHRNWRLIHRHHAHTWLNIECSVDPLEPGSRLSIHIADIIDAWALFAKNGEDLTSNAKMELRRPHPSRLRVNDRSSHFAMQCWVFAVVGPLVADNIVWTDERNSNWFAGDQSWRVKRCCTEYEDLNADLRSTRSSFTDTYNRLLALDDWWEWVFDWYGDACFRHFSLSNYTLRWLSTECKRHSGSNDRGHDIKLDNYRLECTTDGRRLSSPYRTAWSSHIHVGACQSLDIWCVVEPITTSFCVLANPLNHNKKPEFFVLASSITISLLCIRSPKPRLNRNHLLIQNRVPRRQRCLPRVNNTRHHITSISEFVCFSSALNIRHSDQLTRR